MLANSKQSNHLNGLNFTSVGWFFELKKNPLVLAFEIFQNKKPPISLFENLKEPTIFMEKLANNCSLVSFLTFVLRSAVIYQNWPFEDFENQQVRGCILGVDN